MNFHRIGRLALAAVLTAGSLAAHAERTAFELRYFQLDKHLPSGGTVQGEDGFANGDPYTGITYYAPGNPPLVGGYYPSGFTANAERTGAAPDFLGTQFGLGGLKFRYGDAAITTNNLTPPGFDTRSLTLQPSVVPGTALGLVNRDAGFEVEAAWNYSVPEAGESIIFGLNGTGGPDYVGRLQLRFGSNYQTGLPSFTFEQLTRVGSVVTRTILGSVTPQDIFGNLADVDYVGLQFTRDLPSTGTPNPGVHATVTLADASYDAAHDGATVLAQYTFSAEGMTFLTTGDGGRFTGVYSQAQWLDPAPSVPEPGTWALMLAGLGLVGFGARRRRG